MALDTRRTGRAAWRQHSCGQRSTTWLALVAGGFVLAELLIVTPRTYLSWDEALYVSQLSTSVPAMGLDAHRSLGVPLLVGPIAAITTSVAAIRVYLSVLTGLGLFLAYRPWIGVSSSVAPLAALLFGSLSVTLTNGNVALPNMFVALGAVAGTGYFLSAVYRPGTRSVLLGLAAAFAVLSLVRPTEAVWVATPLLAAAAVVPSWRRSALGPASAIVGGLTVGGVLWLVEAYVRFGGPLTRLATMREITGAGMNLVLLEQMATLGRSIGEDPWRGMLVGAVVLWSTLTGLLVLGLRTARGTPAMPAWTLAVVTALVVCGPYLVFLSYPSERYLLPGAALLAFPVAGGVRWALTDHPSARRGSRRSGKATALAAGVAALLMAHIGSQLWAARIGTEESSVAHGMESLSADRLRALGLRPPCFVSGSFAPQIAYAARCSARDVAYAARRASVEIGSWQERHPETVPTLVQRDLRLAHAQGRRFVVVARSAQRPAHLAGWPRVKLLADRPWYAYFPPSGSPPPANSPSPTGPTSPAHP